MQRTNLSARACPIARGLEHVGEWWNMLILRDALGGMTRFDEFETSLGIAPAMLTRRLTGLVASGMLERRRYSERPPRFDYLPTARAEDFRPVLLALFAWGNRHFAPDGATMLIVDRATGAAVDPVLVDPATGREIAAPEYAIAPGPAATPGVLSRLARGGMLRAGAPEPIEDRRT